jgi:hypothetical protein
VLLGVFTAGVCTVNPASDRVLTADDQLLVVRARPVDRAGFGAASRT